MIEKSVRFTSPSSFISESLFVRFDVLSQSKAKSDISVRLIALSPFMSLNLCLIMLPLVAVVLLPKLSSPNTSISLFPRLRSKVFCQEVLFA